MTELEPIVRQLAVPLIGELVDLDQPNQVAQALEAVREATKALDYARRILTEELVDEARRQGTKTLHLSKLDVEITGGTRTEYDAHKLQLMLRSLGMPEHRISEVVVETVTYKVHGTRIKSVASANPDYADAINACRTVVEIPWRVSVKR